MSQPKHYKQIIGNVNQLMCVGLGGRLPVNVNGNIAPNPRRSMIAQKLINLGGRGGNISAIRPGYVNWRMDSSTIISGMSAIFLAASMLNPLVGNAINYTFNGALFAKIGKRARVIADQGFNHSIAANTQILIRTAAQTSTEGLTIVGGNLRGSLTYDVDKLHNDDITPPDDSSDCLGPVHNNTSIGAYAPTNGVNASFPLTPACILGFSERPQVSIYAITDSNGYGTGDIGNGDGQGGVGYIERGCRISAKGTTCLTLAARSGGTLNIYTPGNAAQLFDFAEYHTHFLQQISGNSISAGLTLAQMKQQVIRSWKTARNYKLKTIQLASLPHTIDASNAAVAVGWEIGGLRDQFNAWCASIVGQKIDDNGNLSESGTIWLDAFWNCNDLLHDPSTNLWLSASYTSDGIHLSAIGHALAAARIAILANALEVHSV